MFVLTMKFNKKTAAFIVIMAALVLIGIVLLAGARNAAQQQKTETGIINVKNDKGRAEYLAQYGWEVETPALTEQMILIPRNFSDVFSQYNELQKKQGFDLSDYCGMEVELYTYKVLNCEEGENVLAELYVLNNCVIGGDIHSSELDGFMRGIK